MTKQKAIPQGYMTVGQVAKKMGVTVRTLQYYDKKGLLAPSAESKGGRRLYTDKDSIILHQIISLTATEQLRTEVLQMRTVNFKKYADIIINLQMKNEFYYLIKHFSDDTLFFKAWRESAGGGGEMSNAIQVCELKKNYGSHAVLKGLNFKIASGEIFALLGVNGAGKTTALECIEGLRRYDSGTITIEGKTGIQLQSSSLPAHIKPMEAVKLFAKWNKVEVDHAMVAALGIKEIERKQYTQLSTGQKRRLHLALALISNPDIIFLDEPTAGLDVEGRLSLHEQIRKLKAQGKTIILASHDMAEVEALCDRIAILNEGNIVFCGTALELTEKIGKKYFIHIKTRQGSDTFETGNIEDTLLSLLSELKRKGIDILNIQVDRGTLEEHFMELTRRADE